MSGGCMQSASRRYPVYLLYWYKSANTDANAPAAVPSDADRIRRRRQKPQAGNSGGTPDCWPQGSPAASDSANAKLAHGKLLGPPLQDRTVFQAFQQESSSLPAAAR